MVLMKTPWTDVRHQTQRSPVGAATVLVWPGGRAVVRSFVARAMRETLSPDYPCKRSECLRTTVEGFCLMGDP